MHTIDLSQINTHTDLVIDEFKDDKDIIHELNTYGDIKVDYFTINQNISNKKAGHYVTISFNDITDKDNFTSCENIFIQELKKFFAKEKIILPSSFLILGLGNSKTTADSLGPKTIDNILVTRHLFMLGDIATGYQNVSALAPGVIGDTGLEVSDIVSGLITNIKPDVLIVIDALMSSAISRLNKTIQITDTGISPGSGIGNNRKELSFKTLGIPVVAIGIPTIVAASTIVVDALEMLLKKISYNIKNINNPSSKFKLGEYIKEQSILTASEKTSLMGMLGTLSEEDLNELILEILSPINYNLMVSPKEEDFLVAKLALLISNGLNKSLHESFNPTK